MGKRTFMAKKITLLAVLLLLLIPLSSLTYAREVTIDVRMKRSILAKD